MAAPSSSPTADDIVLGSSCATKLLAGPSASQSTISTRMHPFHHSLSTGTARRGPLSPLHRFPPATVAACSVSPVSMAPIARAVGAVLGVAGDGSPSGSLTEHWDGTSWSIVPSPTPAGDAPALLQGVSCTSASDCWAVGFGTDQNGENLNSVTEHSGWIVVVPGVECRNE